MFEEEDLDNLRKKFLVHPLVFQRSKEHSKNLGELYDTLTDIPTAFPIAWDDKEHRWITPDLFLVNKLEGKLSDI